jgi:glutaredoxin
MNKSQKAVRVVYWTIAIVIIALTMVYLNKLNTPPADNKLLFFFGNTCPHCKNVEKYMEDNGVKSRLIIEELEVMDDHQNQVKMILYASKCGLGSDGLNVPLLYHAGKCYIGDVDVIAHLKTAMGAG